VEVSGSNIPTTVLQLLRFQSLIIAGGFVTRRSCPLRRQGDIDLLSEN
jgi:hypothetical protein